MSSISEKVVYITVSIENLRENQERLLLGLEKLQESREELSTKIDSVHTELKLYKKGQATFYSGLLVGLSILFPPLAYIVETLVEKFLKFYYPTTLN